MNELTFYSKQQQCSKMKFLQEYLILVMNQVYIIAADLYCHKSCISGYEIKFKSSMESKTVLKQPKKQDIFSNYITFLKTIIENGNGISLSELRDMLNENENVLFNNSELKSFISDSFGDNIQFCYSERQNESIFVFSSKVNMKRCHR